MRTLLQLYPGAAAAVLAINVLVQAAVVVVLALLASHLVLRRLAAVRSLRTRLRPGQSRDRVARQPGRNVGNPDSISAH